MAYKFQVGPASLSGSLKRSGSMDIMNAVGVSSFTVDSSSGNLSGSGTADFGSNLQVAGTGHIEGACTFDSTVLVGGTLSSSIAIRAGGADAWGFSDAGVAKFAATSINGALTGVTTLAASGLASVASISMDDGSTLGPDSVAGLWTFSAAGDTTQADGAYDFDLASHDGTNGLKLGGVLVNASAADLNFTNVATAGTAEASKALVLDANKDIGTIRNLTIDGAFTDGNYTFDTSGNVSGLGTVGCGAITSTGASSLGSISSVAAITSTAHISGATMQAGTLTATGNVVGTTLTGSTAVRTGGADAWGFSSAGVAKFAATSINGALTGVTTLAASGLASVTSVTASSTLGVEGATTLKSTVALPGVADTAAAVAADSFYFLDADDNLMKRASMAGYATALAGTTANSGLKAASGVLTLDIANVTPAAIASTDTILFNDQNGDVVRQETIDDVATLFAGDGLIANSAVIQLDLDALASVDVVVANDSIAIVSAANSNGSKKESIADLATAMAGTGVTATAGVFSVDTTGGDSMSAVAIADGGNVAAGLNYLAAITADATVTLPTPGKGDVCVIKAHTIAAGKELIINRSGTQTIDGLTSISIRSDYGAVTLIATAAGTACDWRIA